MKHLRSLSVGKHSVQFTSQLLQMSLDYVNGLMQDAVSYLDREMGSKLDRERVPHILTYLTAKTMELRAFQYGIPAFRAEGRESQDEGEIQDIIFEKWSGMDDKVSLFGLYCMYTVKNSICQLGSGNNKKDSH